MPNIGISDGRRKSPSMSKVFSSGACARAHARLAEIVLLPSCGIVLVMSTFFNGRVRRRSLKRTPSSRIASAVGLSLSVRHTNRLCGVSESSSDGSRSRTSERLEVDGPCATLAAGLAWTGEDTAIPPSLSSRLSSITSGFEGGSELPHLSETRRSARRNSSGP